MSMTKSRARNEALNGVTDLVDALFTARCATSLVHLHVSHPLIVNAIAVLDVDTAAVKRTAQQAGLPPQAATAISNVLNVSRFFRTVLGLWNVLAALLFIFVW